MSLDFESFSALANALQTANPGLSEDDTLDYAALIGDTPIVGPEGLLWVLNSQGEIVAKLKVPAGFAV